MVKIEIFIYNPISGLIKMQDCSRQPKVDRARYIESLGSYFRPSPESGLLVYDGKLITEPSDNFQLYSDVSGYDTLVVKIGTGVITHKERRRTAHNMMCIAEDIRQIKEDTGMKVLVVSSGAIGLGRKERLRRGDKIPEKEKYSPVQKQLDAVEGQYMLYSLWLQSLYPEFTMESLVTYDDLRDPQRKDKLFSTYRGWLDKGMIPVINENDSKILEEIDIQLKGERVFRDNDGLASLIAGQLSDEGYKTMLVILSNTNGIYTVESCINEEFTPIRVVKNPGGLENQVFFTTSKRGRGGMLSKIQAAQDAADKGVYVVIANGQYCNHDSDFQKKMHGAKRRYDVLKAVMKGKAAGTIFLPKDYPPE